MTPSLRGRYARLLTAAAQCDRPPAASKPREGMGCGDGGRAASGAAGVQRLRWAETCSISSLMKSVALTYSFGRHRQRPEASRARAAAAGQAQAEQGRVVLDQFRSVLEPSPAVLSTSHQVITAMCSSSPRARAEGIDGVRSVVTSGRTPHRETASSASLSFFLRGFLLAGGPPASFPSGPRW